MSGGFESTCTELVAVHQYWTLVKQADLQLQQLSKPLDWQSTSLPAYPNEIQAFPQFLSLPENHVVSIRQLLHSIEIRDIHVASDSCKLPGSLVLL